MSRAEDALMRLYEDADLRDELTDDEAAQMLKWAEAELTRLDASSPDDAAFASQVDALFDLLKRMNRFAGRQGQLAPQAFAQSNDQTPANIAALAAQLGHPASPEQVAGTGTGDPSGTLTALINLMSAAPTDSPSDQTAETPSAKSAPLSDQSAPPDQPSNDSPDTSFGAYVDEYDL